MAPTYVGLADLIEAEPTTWGVPSLCKDWRVRHVVAHVTLPTRLTPEQFGAEMAAAGGDFTKLSTTVADRDASLPPGDLRAALRSADMYTWQPPDGGADGTLSHAVIHSLDISLALDRPTVAPREAVTIVGNQLAAADGAMFGIDLTEIRLEADDSDWGWADGQTIRADHGSLVALLSGRTLPDGRNLSQR